MFKRRKTHIHVPSVEGSLGYPPDLPGGERVTTGSEPRRKFTVLRYIGGVVPSPWVVDADPNLRVVEVVEPGHDEQTEACRVCGGRGWHTAGGNDPAACGACVAGEAWYGWAEWQPDPRTVAAVVEALKEARHNARTGTQADAFSRAALFIEERFKPSAPGGDDAGG